MRDLFDARLPESRDHMTTEETDTYDVWWRREGDDEVYYCETLSPIKFIRRLIAANHNFGEVTIVRMERTHD